jgi:hypothetical protein
MNKPGSPLQTQIFVMDRSSHPDHEPARRLIVLISMHTDYRFATRRILDLAMASGAGVLFLGLCKDPAYALGLRRELVSVSALFQDAGICVEANVEVGPNWMDIVKSKCHAGDTIVCFAEQGAGPLQRPLNQILESDLGAPVYILSDVHHQSHARSNRLSEIIAWTGFIAIIAGSFLLQIQIRPMPGDWAQTILLILSVIAELWLIWVWNGQFR